MRYETGVKSVYCMCVTVVRACTTIVVAVVSLQDEVRRRYLSRRPNVSKALINKLLLYRIPLKYASPLSTLQGKGRGAFCRVLLGRVRHVYKI